MLWPDDQMPWPARLLLLNKLRHTQRKSKLTMALIWLPCCRIDHKNSRTAAFGAQRSRRSYEHETLSRAVSGCWSARQQLGCRQEHGCRLRFLFGSSAT